MTTKEHNKFKCVLMHAKETKWTHQYKETGDKPDNKIGTLYIKKTETGTVAPAKITVTVEW